MLNENYSIIHPVVLSRTSAFCLNKPGHHDACGKLLKVVYRKTFSLSSQRRRNIYTIKDVFVAELSAILGLYMILPQFQRSFDWIWELL